jgi:tRNA threonylcarbamoyladenosine biosynthesis protein TsaE
VAIILIIKLDNIGKTQIFARQLAKHIQQLNQGIVIYLDGDLGAGKTTLARNFIQFFGFDKVKSPTYSIVESYINKQISIHHFDCYRLSDPEELEYIGIREYSSSNNIQLIEWANLGKNIIEPADMIINISGADDTRTLSISTHSKISEQLLVCLKT